jgi:hypothetical protein
MYKISKIILQRLGCPVSKELAFLLMSYLGNQEKWLLASIICLPQCKALNGLQK